MSIRFKLESYRKFLSLLIFLVPLSVAVWAQQTTQNIELDKIFRVACADVPQESIFIFNIKDYELRIEDPVERERITIDPQWVKSIEIIKRSELLIAQGYEADATLVILTLKNRKWKRLPDALKREFVQVKD